MRRSIKGADLDRNVADSIERVASKYIGRTADWVATNLLIPQIACPNSLIPVPWEVINGGLEVDRTKSKHMPEAQIGDASAQNRRGAVSQWIAFAPLTKYYQKCQINGCQKKTVVSCLSVISHHDLDLQNHNEAVHIHLCNAATNTLHLGQ